MLQLIVNCIRLYRNIGYCPFKKPSCSEKPASVIVEQIFMHCHILVTFNPSILHVSYLIPPPAPRQHPFLYVTISPLIHPLTLPLTEVFVMHMHTCKKADRKPTYTWQRKLFSGEIYLGKSRLPKPLHRLRNPGVTFT